MKQLRRIQVNEQLRETQQHGSYGFPMQVYLDDLDRYDIGKVAWHWHPEIELGVMLRGRATLLATDKRLELGEGSGFFVNANALHAVESPESGVVFHSIVFSPKLLTGYIGSSIEQKYIKPLLEAQGMSILRFGRREGWQAEITSAIRRICGLFESKDPGFELGIQAALYMLWQALYAGCRDRLGELSETAPTKDDTRIKQMLDYIHSHYAEDIALESIAEAANISKSECCRCFKRTLKTTPFGYLSQHRLSAASRLLLQGVTSTDACVRVGFSGPSYFGKQFKGLFGCTPAQFKIMHRD